MISAFPGQLEPWLWTAESWAGFQFGVLAIAAIFGWRQLREARRLREASLRPFVVVDFELEENIEIYLSISNMGSTLACDVQITFDHPFEIGALKAKAGEERSIDRFTDRLSRGIPNLAPGKKIRTLLDLTNHRGEQGNLRDVYVATIGYRSDVTGKRYTDTSVLDLGVYWGRVWINKKGLHQIGEQLEKIAKELGALSNQGIKTIGRRDRRLRNAEMWAHERSRRGPFPLRIYNRVKRRALLKLS